MPKIKKTSNKPYKSVFQNALWSFRYVLKDAPSAFWCLIAELPLNIFLAWTTIYLPSLAVALVTNKKTVTEAVLSIGTLMLCILIATVLVSVFQNIRGVSILRYRFRMLDYLNQKTFTCFYQQKESAKNQTLYERAQQATWESNGNQPLTDMPLRSVHLIQNAACYLLFGSVISFVSPWLVLLLTVAPTVNWLCAKTYQKWEYSHRDCWTDVDRKLWYVQTTPADYATAKDIRIYSMAGWFREMAQILSKERTAWDREMTSRQFLSRIADLVVVLLRDGAAYALLIIMFMNGEITVDQFVLFFAAISSFATYVGNIMNEWNGARETSLIICDFRQYLDLPEYDGTGEEKVADHIGRAPAITFDNVSFRYEGAEEDTLRNISFSIKAGEKIAIVGLNGAGKTTLVKLLCGLYIPTKGDIHINDVSISKFKRADYYALFSPVFQDSRTAFFTLAETVSGQCGDAINPERVEDCLRRAGLGNKIDQLPKGIYTYLDKQLHEDGTELSGGEVQKLMLARALYKDAPVLVLDEPTAALDPIAENAIYQQYCEMTANKTSIFISHRLASTRFCDRIFYLKNGQIQECGSHAELMAQGGEYKDLFDIQSCWYKEKEATT